MRTSNCTTVYDGTALHPVIGVTGARVRLTIAGAYEGRDSQDAMDKGGLSTL